MRRKILYNILNEWRDEDMDDLPIDLDDDIYFDSNVSGISDEPDLDDDEFALSTSQIVPQSFIKKNFGEFYLRDIQSDKDLNIDFYDNDILNKKLKDFQTIRDISEFIHEISHSFEIPETLEYCDMCHKIIPDVLFYIYGTDALLNYNKGLYDYLKCYNYKHILFKSIDGGNNERCFCYSSMNVGDLEKNDLCVSVDDNDCILVDLSIWTNQNQLAFEHFLNIAGHDIIFRVPYFNFDIKEKTFKEFTLILFDFVKRFFYQQNLDILKENIEKVYNLNNEYINLLDIKSDICEYIEYIYDNYGLEFVRPNNMYHVYDKSNSGGSKHVGNIYMIP